MHVFVLRHLILILIMLVKVKTHGVTIPTELPILLRSKREEREEAERIIKVYNHTASCHI